MERDRVKIYKYNDQLLTAQQIADMYHVTNSDVHNCYRKRRKVKGKSITLYGIRRLLYTASNGTVHYQGYCDEIADKLGYCRQSIYKASMTREELNGFKITCSEVIDFGCAD